MEHIVDIRALERDCRRDLNMVGLFPKKVVDVSWNRRKSSWGLCRYHGSTCSIELSSLLKENYEGARETMFHELLHACPDGNGHKGKWKEYAALVNKEYGLHIKRCSNAEDKGMSEEQVGRDYKYEIYCPVCKRVVAKKAKMSKSVKDISGGLHNWSCCKCGCNHLEVHNL